MHAVLVVSSIMTVLCSAHLAHKHSHLSEEHYVDGEHNADYDREALFGGEEEAEEFTKLSPEEQQERLKVIVKKIDADSDGFLSEEELTEWIQQSFRHYAVEDTRQQFPDYDVDSDGVITWEEYNIQMYDRIIDFDANTVLEDEEEESFRQLHLRDKKRFDNADIGGIPGLSIEEFLAFEHPEEVDYMEDYVIQEALEEHDKDGDGFVSLNEFLGDYRRDPGAKEDPEWIIVEIDRFENDYDANGDGKLDRKELLSWVIPNNKDVALDEATHLIEEMDLNGDRKLTVDEILYSQDLFLNSEATDYGRQLHDEHLFHDEL
ncbi:reticulocalbin-2 [Protopterus annectens]|uniref:reticulocalbin-2 n=1 Tax=Protopterus annectens TaxID=7888 RepID=UPI001CFA30F1|nr:reticulocalbin-2 [Protopterus annectens]XP_043933399.1 reticulocalbin-2 [Protopterus annectens]